MPRNQERKLQNKKPKSPFLQSADDWDQWKKRTEGPRLEEPKEPTLQPVKSLAESLVELALSDLTSLHSLAAQYKADLAHYHKARRAMDDLFKNHHGIYIQLNMDLCSKMCTASLTKS
ncbi:hypothetical protein POX_c04276 [Penicillium oxalicum]|uniref:Uncharacterized protein n=1 Tax=Penicillium oxalicum (strain 114-2 / CGMCC 5302) TaxID=933388 RepID=S7Z6Z1_PENO1|nr:hypothetical protein POX_c04276 [Penicillium oxalicum]EPS25899.1 hypothetical protein PDE_00835 [Penicillium oxalicum 114-2]KAI2791416.1 hypothetical protein POX_c04276 [Penicillium oxalicum]